MEKRIAELNKKPGVCYALTNDGIELPVIDITHPAFAFRITDEECSILIDNMQKASNIPPSVLQNVAKTSILVRGMVESAGTFTTGIMTYLNKLGPEMLGDGYAGPIDRQWAGSLTPVTFRWRMRDVVELLAGSVRKALANRPVQPRCPVHMINIGGGPAMDSLNALIVLQKNHPGLLDRHEITIHVLDLDADGPEFGARALHALQADAAPLQGLSVLFEHMKYDWAFPKALGDLIRSISNDDAVVVGSTEGGLFEYAADAEIVENLRLLHEGTPPDMAMVGPVVRDAQNCDPRLSKMDQVPGRPAIRFMGIKTFRGLAEAAGWHISAQLDSPMHQVVCLSKN